MQRLQDKIALFTGAGLGLGGAVAQAMAKEGTHLNQFRVIFDTGWNL